MVKWAAVVADSNSVSVDLHAQHQAAIDLPFLLLAGMPDALRYPSGCGRRETQLDGILANSAHRAETAGQVYLAVEISRDLEVLSGGLCRTRVAGGNTLSDGGGPETHET